MIRFVSALSVFSLLLLFTFFAGCGNRSEETELPPEFRPYLSPGMKAADFQGRTMENKFLRFSKYKGQVILMTFWRKKCGICANYLLELEKVHQRYKGREFTSFAINGDNLDYVPSHKIIEFVKERGITYPSWLDDQREATEGYKIIKIPITFLIDRKGVIADIQYDPVDWNTPENRVKIEKLL